MCGCIRPSPPAGAVRPLYEEGERLGAEELQAQQDHRRQRLRRHNRLLHGWGVVCGLRVVPDPDPDRLWRVRVCPGYALGPYGDEILVPCASRVDVAERLWEAPSAAPPFAFIGVRYHEEPGTAIPQAPALCGCPAPSLLPSRVRDGHRVDVLWSARRLRPSAVDLCRPRLARCPPCPPSPYVLLARVRLPADLDVPITAQDIDNW
jgi:hypothetical protein